MTEISNAGRFLNGEILLFDKPLGWTSFDLVRKVRNVLYRSYKLKKLKVGHAGTLDPCATGLMILCTGKATKQIDLLQAQEKEYIATLKLGATTPSYDLETEENAVFPIGHINFETIEQTLKQFVGNIEQIPPVFSAVKINGKRAYEHARRGEEPEIKPKNIVVYDIKILSFDMPEVKLLITCSKGTYIRAIARDLGFALQSGAYLTGLRRTRSGQFNVDDALFIDNFLKEYDSNDLKI
ncbi:MAG: tRNA pseudouridine(55) synthase TruB [Prolixibacteraceae bacterium]|nr:tRNA pseudouridine(55) synthase TruB [Prolixibacteraceae bacterium]